MSFLAKIKSVFRSDKGPVYRNYTPPELKVVAMKTRIILEEYQKKCYKQISQQDSLLIQSRLLPNEGYKLMQEIGHHVIEVESIKIYI